MAKKVLLIGGLGFIGYHLSRELSNNDFEVSIAHRSKLPKSESDYELLHLDLHSMALDVLVDKLKEFDFVVFCGGADDRTLPIGDAAAFYYQENVVPCLRLVEASLETKLEKIVLLGSYFSHFDRNRPEWQLKEKHPYIKSRYLQQIKPVDLAQNKLQVSTVEIPYVFGAAPGKIPLWKPLVDYIDKMPFVFYTNGGTNIMSVEQVAKAVSGVLNAKEYKSHWIIGSENVSWTKLVQMFARALGKKRRVILIPDFIVSSIAFLVKVYFKLFRKQAGLDPYHFVNVQTANTFLDLEESRSALGYSKVDMQKSINATVEACGYALKE